MQESIKVHVVDYGRSSLYLRYTDPHTGKQIAKSSGTSNRKEATKAAGKWEDELRDGRYKPASKITWAEFRRRYEDEVLPGLADNTDLKTGGVFNAVQRILNPDRLASLTTERISYFVRVLREERIVETKTVEGAEREVVKLVRRSESTIAGHLATLKAALNWATRQGMLREVPSIDMPSRARDGKLMKGRPIAAEEFERMLAAVDKVATIPEAARESWKHLLRGLWASGLRLGEALALTWDMHSKPRIEFAGRRPLMLIPAEHQKNHTDTLHPIAPEFAEFLQATPEAARTGYVFRVPLRRTDSVSKIITAVGKMACVKVNVDSRTGKAKYASAHDLRRSFGERWAKRIMPAVLQKLMRHSQIETTLRYYAGLDAESTADALWEAVPNYARDIHGNRVGAVESPPFSGENDWPFGATVESTAGDRE